MALKPDDINRAVDLIERIAGALDKFDFLAPEELKQLLEYRSYELRREHELVLSRLQSRRFDQNADDQRRKEAGYDPEVSKALKDKLADVVKKHNQDVLQPLQKELDLLLVSLWPEILQHSEEGEILKKGVEGLLRQTVAQCLNDKYIRFLETLPGYNCTKLPREADRVQDIVHEFRRIKARLEGSSAVKEQNTTTAKRGKIWTWFKNVVEKGWQIFTKSFWEALLEKMWPK